MHGEKGYKFESNSAKPIQDSHERIGYEIKFQQDNLVIKGNQALVSANGK